MIDQSLLSAGYSRRDFMKAVTTATAVMGLPLAKAEEVIAAAEKTDNRPPVIWLHFQECTGCSEALLRANHPGLAELILDLINLEYQETIMAGSGPQANKSLEDAIKKHSGKYILIIEGSIPEKDNGIYCQIGGKTALEEFNHAAEHAFAVVNLGVCAVDGGISAIAPNPTGAAGAPKFMPEGKPFINLPGCPPNPYNLLSVVLYLLTFNKLPELDAMNRPVFAYGRLIHEHCERRPHFDAGRFVKEFGDEGHREGYCLYQMGCKGPVTHANCSIIRFNDGVAWPVGVGSPCIGCTEGSVLFQDSLFALAPVAQPTPNANVPTSQPEGLGKPASGVQMGVVGAALGAVVGAGAVYAAKLPKEPEDEHN